MVVADHNKLDLEFNTSVNDLIDRTSITHNTVDRPGNLRMAHKDHLLHSRQRKDWLRLAQSMPLARLLLVARKFEMMERPLIDRGHECLSDCGRVLDHDLDSDFDLDSEPDSDPVHHSA